MMFRVVFWDIYCRVKWLSTDVSEVRTAPIIRDEWVCGDGGSTHLWNVGRQSFYTAVYPRRQLWTSLYNSIYLMKNNQLKKLQKHKSHVKNCEIEGRQRNVSADLKTLSQHSQKKEVGKTATHLSLSRWILRPDKKPWPQGQKFHYLFINS
jgi:hypothetical protein